MRRIVVILTAGILLTFFAVFSYGQNRTIFCSAGQFLTGISGGSAICSQPKQVNIPEVQNSVTGTYTVNSTSSADDCGKRIVASGGTLYTITFNAATNYDASCKVLITNTDPMPTGANSTAAKLVNINGIHGCMTSQTLTYVWPQQSMEVTRVGSAWVITKCPGLWEMPGAGVFTLNVDPSNGSDTWGVSDGLAVGSRAFKSAQGALDVAAETMQENFFDQTQFTVKLCSTCIDSQQIHMPSHGGSPLGAQGGDGTIVDCNNGTLSGGVQLFFQSTLEFKNCTFLTNAILVTDNSVLVFNGTNNTLSSATLQVSVGGQIRAATNPATINVTGSFFDIFQVSQGSVTGITINQTGNVTYSDAAMRVAAGGYVTIAGWTTNSFSATGTKYTLLECGIMEGVSFVAGSVGGSASCTQAN